MLKERFSKLLLGEDMQSGNGICMALAKSNAIINLWGMLCLFSTHCLIFYLGLTYYLIFYLGLTLVTEYNVDSLSHCFVIVTLFGQQWRWRRKMNWLLCVSDHIAELMPTRQMFPD